MFIYEEFTVLKHICHQRFTHTSTFSAKLETLAEDSTFIAAAANITLSLPWNNKQLVKSAKV